MEVTAKEFAATHGGTVKTFYEQDGWNKPTEMGIMQGTSKHNTGVNKIDFLDKRIELIKWKINRETQQDIQEIFLHDPIY
jgi:hypothetical protein